MGRQCSNRQGSVFRNWVMLVKAGPIFYEEIIESAWKLLQKEARIFRAWEEGLENRKVGPEKDDRFEAALLAKYGGLCWLDIEYNYRRVETHLTKFVFQKKRGDNKYMIFATYEGFDL